MSKSMRVPYTQQFTPKQTPLPKLLAVLRENSGNRAVLRDAIAAAFFRDTKTPAKIAGNTIIALNTYGIIDAKTSLTDFGRSLAAMKTDSEMVKALARHILLELDGLGIIETLREMKAGAVKTSLTTIPEELKKRGYEASKNSSDLSGMLGWLKAAGILRDYEVDDAACSELLGESAPQLDALTKLPLEQAFFLRALVALGSDDFVPHNEVAKHAEELYAGQVRFNWKALDRAVLKPLQEAGLIEIRRKAKSGKGARGGKPAEVKPTGRFNAEIRDRILGAVARAAGYSVLRDISSKSWADVVAQIEQGKDRDRRARGLELLTIKICQTLDLDFMGWRTTDDELTAGGEVDAMLHSSRLIYSRWQIQCKASPTISFEAIAKEVGAAHATLASVILIAGTGEASKNAKKYREQIVRTTNLNIIILEGHHLKRIASNPAEIVRILNEQAQDALRLKGKPYVDTSSGPPFSGLEKELPEDRSDGPAESSNRRAAVHDLKPAYTTDNGEMYQGDALAVLDALIARGVRAKLIMTSPPFALLRKKAYGNEEADQYIAWFMQFSERFEKILEPDGSLVIDIGGSWVRGLPVRSTYHFELLLRLCRSGFHLAQEFYHYNPARLPTPAEWVTIRRLRVKDAVNTVWWLVKNPFAPADNRRVLRPYSDSMRDLLKNGYDARLRPSGHDISTKFQKDNGGSIPPNLLTLSNTESNSFYLSECRREGIAPHPARFPRGLPEFFIKFLTQEGDVVLDPFAGSNVTGEAAEVTGRRWIGIELNKEYVRGSRFRFVRGDGFSGERRKRDAKRVAEGGETANLFPAQTH
jgi:DNA modification methylase